MMTFVACLLALQPSWSQKTNSNKSVSQLISTGASDAVILKSWENLVLQKQIKSYPEAEQLLAQTMKVAFLQGNRNLGASVTKTAYYSTLTIALSKEIATVQAAIQNANQADITEKNFKLKPNARDLQRLSGVGIKMDLKSQRLHRFNLINKAQSVLAFVPGFQSSKGYKAPMTGKNKKQAVLPNVFKSSDVILSKGRAVTQTEQLKIYLERLKTAYITANTDLKISGTQLQGITMMQQQVAQNEAALSKKLLTKAATIID